MATPQAMLESRFQGDQLFNPNENERVDPTAPRWVGSVADLADPRVMRLRKDFSWGGEYLGNQYATLYRTRYLLRKCEITPMLPAMDWTSDMDKGSDEQRPVYREDPNPLDPTGKPVGRYGYPVNPGDQITSLINTGANNDFGVREFETLRNVTESEVRREDFQNRIFNGSKSFPAWGEYIAMSMDDRKPFVKLSALERHLNFRLKNESGDLRDLIETYLASCEQYRIWGDDFLDRDTRRVKTPMSQTGYVHGYSVTAIKLFEQLEVTSDEYMRRDHVIPHAPIADSEVKELLLSMGKMMQKQAQTIDLLAQGQPEAPAITKEEVFAPIGSPAITSNETATGAQNVTEPVTEKLSYAVGVKVSVPVKDSDERIEGVIKMKPGGKYVVEFVDGSKGTFEYAELTLSANN